MDGMRYKEVLTLEVIDNALWRHALGEHNGIPLDGPLDQNARGADAQLLGDFGDDGVVEDAVSVNFLVPLVGK